MLKVKTLEKKTILIPKREYERLKHLDTRVGRWVTYLDYLQDIRDARREIKTGIVVSQSNLFRKLGL